MRFLSKQLDKVFARETKRRNKKTKSRVIKADKNKKENIEKKQ